MARKTRNLGVSDEENLELYENQLKRLMEIAGVNAENQLCTKYKLQPANATGWRTRRNLPPSLVIEIAADTGASIDYIIFGETDKKWRSKNKQSKSLSLTMDNYFKIVSSLELEDLDKTLLYGISAKISSITDQEKKALLSIFVITAKASQKEIKKEINFNFTETEKLFIEKMKKVFTIQDFKLISKKNILESLFSQNFTSKWSTIEQLNGVYDIFKTTMDLNNPCEVETMSQVILNYFLDLNKENTLRS
jgi:hypothetical protein